MKIRQFTWNVIDSNSWLIVEDDHGLLIDAVDSSELYKAINEISDLIIILTHSHFDHICGLNKIRKIHPKVMVYATSLCSKNIGNKIRNMSSSGNVFMSFYRNKSVDNEEIIDENIKIDVIEPFICDPADYVFDEGMSLEWLNHTIDLNQYYGHSKDSLIAVLDGKYMFSGDTILGIPTATRFIGGSNARFWEEDIPKLEGLVEQISFVYPGHGQPDELNRMISVNHRPAKYREKGL